MDTAFRNGFVGAAGAFTFALLLGLLLAALVPPLPEDDARIRRCARA